MRKWLMVSLLAIFALAATSPAMAQIPQSDCHLGVYADAGATVSILTPTQGTPFQVYVVMILEGLVNAVAFDLLVPELNSQIFITESSWGPAGNGINIETANGSNIGLGECAVGFGGIPIVVATYTMLMPFETLSARTIGIGPNLDSDPEAPFFAVCTGQLYACTIATPLILTAPVETESKSFGQIKALY
jgi:hypothetical protein